MEAGSHQTGMTLIEVLFALLVFSIGMLGVAMLQLNALKHTDSAMRSTQVSFIAQDLLERVRANPAANYSLASLSHAPASGSPDIPRDQDLFDFAEQLRNAVGEDVQASVAVAVNQATVTLDWNDARAQSDDAYRQTLTLSSLVRPERGVQP
jgi:type IV pilus assembly protein PilV